MEEVLRRIGRRAKSGANKRATGRIALYYLRSLRPGGPEVAASIRLVPEGGLEPPRRFRSCGF